jgi:hypothetical protein
MLETAYKRGCANNHSNAHLGTTTMAVICDYSIIGTPSDSKAAKTIETASNSAISASHAWSPIHFLNKSAPKPSHQL